MPFVQTSSTPSIDLHYQDSGSGQGTGLIGGAPTVVLIHGWPMSHRMWEAQVTALTAAGVRTVAYDRRGFGDSGKPWTGYDYDTFAADLDDLMTALDLRDVVLVGFSMGGGEVARYLSRYGADRVSKAVFIGSVTPFLLQTAETPDGAPQKVFDDMQAALKKDRPAFLAGFGKTFFNWGLVSHPVSQEMLDYGQTIALFAQPHATAECVTAFSATDFRADMAAVTVPTLVVHGDADQIVPFEASGKKTAEAIPGARLEVFEGAPHGLYATHADRLNALLLDFLRA